MTIALATTTTVIAFESIVRTSNCGNHGKGHHVAYTAKPLRIDISQRVIAGVVSLFDV